MEEQWNLFGLEPYKIKKKIRLIELFGGIGAQAKALENLGVDFEHYRLCEFDKYAIASYNAVHHTNFETSDITKIHAKDLGVVDTDKYDYILCYSFPCQDLSVAGLTKGMKKGSNTRSGLLWEVERLLKECDELPQCLVLENVTQVHNLKNINDFEDWCKFLNSLGYMNYWEDLNSKDYGIPQNRDRTIMVSILGDYNYEFPKKQELKLRLKDLLENDVDEKYFLSEKMINYIESRMPKGKNKITTGINIKNQELDDLSGTITTANGNRPSDTFIIDKDHFYNKKQGKIEPRVIETGWIKKGENGTQHQSNTVYDANGLARTIVAGEYKSPLKIEINSKEKSKDTDKIIEECNLYNFGIKQYNRRTGSVVNPKGISSTLLARTAGDNNLVLDENDKYNNKAVNETLKLNKIEDGDFIDSYNRNVKKDGISGTITTRVSDSNETFVVVPEATKKGYAEAYEGDGVYINRPHQKRGVVQHDMIQTIKANNSDIGVVVREQDNLKTELCNKLIEEGKVEEGDVVKHSYTQQILDGNKKCVEKSDGIMITLTTRPDCVGVTVKQPSLRIRKLTPKECWRLMGFDDEDYENAAKVNSNAQLYKQAGNSIVVNVLMEVFKQLL